MRKLRHLVLGLVLGGAVLAGPAVAAPADWAGSRFDVPADRTELSSDSSQTTVTGWVVHRSQFPFQRVDLVALTVADDPDDDDSPVAGCTIPDPVVVHRNPDQSVGASSDQWAFAVDFDLECNGRYVVTATAQASGNQETYTFDVDLTVDAPADPARDLEAEADGDRVVTLAWAAPAAVPKDFLGYLVERAGPTEGDEVPTDFSPLGDLVDDTGYVDETDDDGRYRYRVRTVRRGTSGPVVGAPSAEATTQLDVTATTTTTRPGTTTTKPGPSLGSGGSGGSAAPSKRSLPTVPRPASVRPSTPTTVDPGFGELDYRGAEIPTTSSPDDELGDDETAGGVSIVEEEGPGAGLAQPAAIALVLTVWAGHILTLNRLAKHELPAPVVVEA